MASGYKIYGVVNGITQTYDLDEVFEQRTQGGDPKIATTIPINDTTDTSLTDRYWPANAGSKPTNDVQYRAFVSGSYTDLRHLFAVKGSLLRDGIVGLGPAPYVQTTTNQTGSKTYNQTFTATVTGGSGDFDYAFSLEHAGGPLPTLLAAAPENPNLTHFEVEVSATAGNTTASTGQLRCDVTDNISGDVLTVRVFYSVSYTNNDLVGTVDPNPWTDFHQDSSTGHTFATTLQSTITSGSGNYTYAWSVGQTVIGGVPVLTPTNGDADCDVSVSVTSPVAGESFDAYGTIECLVTDTTTSDTLTISVSYDLTHSRTTNTGGTGPGCLVEGTEILLDDGTVIPVEDLEEGMVVVNKLLEGMPDESNEDVHWKHWETKNDIPNADTIKATVKNVWSGESTHMYTINGKLRLTGEHPVFILRNEKWVWRRVDELLLTDHMLGSDNKVVPIESIDYLDIDVNIYNIDVEPQDTYFCGNGDLYVLTHNKVEYPYLQQEN